MLKLARDLGKTRRQLLREISARELAEWIAFYRIENTPPDQLNTPDEEPEPLTLEQEIELMRATL